MTIDACDRFEAIGDLYYRDTGYLRPGKSEPMETGRDANSDENRERFEEWLVMKAFRSAVHRIVQLEREVERLERDDDD